MAFEKTIKGYREVATRVGDTAQKIALRELGDTGRWYEIVNLNGLLPPYLTDDVSLVSETVLLAGGFIKVPSNNQAVSAETEVNDIFGTDAKLNNGRIAVKNGDMQIISGVNNLVQALQNKIATDLGELLFHPDYGCEVHSLIGDSSRSVNALIARGFVERSINSDRRVNKINQSAVTVKGDSIEVEIEAEAVNGREFSVNI